MKIKYQEIEFLGKRYLLSFDENDKVNGWYTKFPNAHIPFVLNKTLEDLKLISTIKLIYENK
jgi:hypothetical protein